MNPKPEHWFEEHRTFLHGLCYRMLGSVAESEDVVQESFMKWLANGKPDLSSPRSWFTKVCTRICIDRLRSAENRKLDYPGQWLPEPLVEDENPIEKAETISTAFLLLLSRLGPIERAAFLLHDIFDEPYGRIAQILNLSQPACRQHVSRARKRLKGSTNRFQVNHKEAQSLTRSFFDAIEEGNLNNLEALLAKNVELISDGGGKVPSVDQPLEGKNRVIRFLSAIFRLKSRNSPREFTRQEFWINRLPAELISIDGKHHSVFQFHIEEGEIRQIFIQRNPEKLSKIV